MDFMLNGALESLDVFYIKFVYFMCVDSIHIGYYKVWFLIDRSDIVVTKLKFKLYSVYTYKKYEISFYIKKNISKVYITTKIS